MNMWDNALIALASIITGTLSWLAARHSKKTESQTAQIDLDIERDRQGDEHTQTLLQGYSSIVDDLREEVRRLNSVINELRHEQEECEKRNDALESVVFDLQRRLANLEMESGR